MSTDRVDRLRGHLPFQDVATGRPGWFVLLGGVGVFVFGVVAVFAPTLAPHAPDARVGQPLHPPGNEHLLGTDDMGHDLLSVLLVGARGSLLVGLLTGSLAILLGLAVGITAGLVGGRVETILLRFVDIVLTLPFLPLVIVAAAVLGPSLWTTIGVLTSVMWARPARELRSQVLSVRQRAYVQASRSMGGSVHHVALRYVVPAVAPIAIAQFVRAVGAAILLEASLSFLGLGDPTAQSWGTILFFAQTRSAFLTDAWTWWVLPPGIAITASVLSFTFLALGVERTRGGDRRRIARDVEGAEFDIDVDSDCDSDCDCDSDIVQSGSQSQSESDRSPAPVLEISDLAVEYGADSGTIAVDHVDLDLREAEVIGVVGESGSGKSSLALALLDLLRSPGRVTSGCITLLTDRGYDDDVALADIRGDEIAFVPQEAMNALDPRMRLHTQVVEAIRTHRSCERAEAATTAHEVLEIVGLAPASHDRYPHELSGGMRQRGVIAIALVNDPAVLVIDEPTTGLDVVTTLNVLNLLTELQAERGFSLVVVSHDLSAVTRIADRLAVMRDGQFVEIGPTSEIKSTPEHPYTRELLSARPRLPVPEADRRPVVHETAEATEVSGSTHVSSTENDPHLAYESVSKTFDGEQVLAGVDLGVARGEAVALIGESGAGKSTLGRMAIGLDDPDGGTVRIAGEAVSHWRARDPRSLGRDVRYLFQDPYGSLPPNRRVGPIVREPLDIHDYRTPAERHALVEQALEDVGLSPTDEYAARYPAGLSGGERQRVAFARAVVLEPSVLIADEPTSMLDAPLRRDVLELLYELIAERDITLLHITHDVAQASSFADRIAVLHEGRIVEEGPPRSILTRPVHEQTRMLVEAAVTLSSDTTVDTPQPSIRDQ